MSRQIRACGLSAGQPPYSLPSAQTSEPPEPPPVEDPPPPGSCAGGRGAGARRVGRGRSGPGGRSVRGACPSRASEGTSVFDGPAFGVARFDGDASGESAGTRVSASRAGACTTGDASRPAASCPAPGGGAVAGPGARGRWTVTQPERAAAATVTRSAAVVVVRCTPRVLVPLPGVAFPSHETWGRGAIWGTHPLKDGRVYAYAAAVAPSGERAPDDERAELLRRYGDWHSPVPEVLAAVRPEDVLRHDVHHIAEPLPAFHLGRVALVGDAAHAMPPTLGQGGNQAVEDAITLAFPRPDMPSCADAPVADGLPGYTAVRLPRTTAVARRAVRTARLNLRTGRVGTVVRDAGLAALAKAAPSLFLRGFDGVADWRPPGGPSGAAGDGSGAPRMLAADHGRRGPEENTP
ncbi:hypothetical protein SALBM217S_02047 [Streptomyces griseoloalbus]